MLNEPEATVPAMDVERRAEQMYAESVIRVDKHVDANHYQLPLNPAAHWLGLSARDKNHFRTLARNDLAEEAKRRGDHDTLREMHGTIQTVTGAASPEAGAMALMYAAGDELATAIRTLVLAVRDLDDTVEDDDKISAAQDAAEVVAGLLGISGN